MIKQQISFDIKPGDHGPRQFRGQLFFFVNHFLQSPESHYYILPESNQGVKVNSLLPSPCTAFSQSLSVNSFR